jgi:hypothetical protein
MGQHRAAFVNAGGKAQMQAPDRRARRRLAIADNGGLTLINHHAAVYRVRNLPVWTLVATAESGCQSARWRLYLTFGMSGSAARTTGLRDA